MNDSLIDKWQAVCEHNSRLICAMLSDREGLECLTTLDNNSDFPIEGMLAGVKVHLVFVKSDAECGYTAFKWSAFPNDKFDTSIFDCRKSIHYVWADKDHVDLKSNWLPCGIGNTEDLTICDVFVEFEEVSNQRIPTVTILAKREFYSPRLTDIQHLTRIGDLHYGKYLPR